MVVNTSIMFLSLLLAPITFLLGPVAALNVGMRLALAASGWPHSVCSGMARPVADRLHRRP